MSIMTLPVSEAKQRFTDLVRGSEELFDRYLITRNGKEAALLMSAEEYASLLETLDILSNGREVRHLPKGWKTRGARERCRWKSTLPVKAGLRSVTAGGEDRAY